MISELYLRVKLEMYDPYLDKNSRKFYVIY